MEEARGRAKILYVRPALADKVKPGILTELQKAISKVL